MTRKEAIELVRIGEKNINTQQRGLIGLIVQYLQNIYQ